MICKSVPNTQSPCKVQVTSPALTSCNANAEDSPRGGPHAVPAGGTGTLILILQHFNTNNEYPSIYYCQQIT